VPRKPVRSAVSGRDSGIEIGTPDRSPAGTGLADDLGRRERTAANKGQQRRRNDGYTAQ
jgi:hypothetical protein